MSNINRVDPYVALADVYQAANFADYSIALAPRLLDLAFSCEWEGRSVLDLACGTGEITNWFAEHGFRATGVDLSPQMLQVARARAEIMGMNVEFVTGDIRSYVPREAYELVTCLGGSLNYIATMRDLENVFRQAHQALLLGKLMMFDLMTIRELAQHEDVDRILLDNGNDKLISVRERFNYESLLLSQQFIIWKYTDQWQRFEETHSLRGYPLQAIQSALSKNGFKVLRTITESFEPYEQHREAGRLIIVAQRES